MADNLFVADLHRHRLVPISEHHRAHVRNRRGPRESRRQRRRAFADECTTAIRAAGIELLRSLLNVLQFTCDDRVASFALTLEIAAERRREARGQRGPHRPHPRDRRRDRRAHSSRNWPRQQSAISLRSKDPRVDVCKICGDSAAAATRSPPARGSADRSQEVEEKVLKAIADEIGHSNSTASCSWTKRRG